MMTSQSTTGTLTLTRSVRDVVTHQPELVTEVWCRKIFRHILQLLERDYALGRPHAPITPDTLGFDEHGEPALTWADSDAPQPGEAADVQALGAVIHYAITLEEWPTMSLRRRGQQGYSESLLTAVDKCMSTDLAERPRSITELRNLLGIVALGPTIGAPPSVPVFAQPASPPVRGMAGVGKWQRWLMIGLAAIVLLGAGSAFLMLLRGTNDSDNVVLTLPEPAPQAAPELRQSPAQALPNLAAGQGALPLDVAGTGAAAPENAAPSSVDQIASADAGSRSPKAAAAHKRPARQIAAASASDDDVTTYKLMIKPWGTVYVDGSERGVSPPLKLLSLPAGRHTVRIVNPHFRDRVVRVSAGKHDMGRINVDFKD